MTRSEPSYTIDYTLSLEEHFKPLLDFLRQYPNAVVKADVIFTEVDRGAGTVTFSFRGVCGVDTKTEFAHFPLLPSRP